MPHPTCALKVAHLSEELEEPETNVRRRTLLAKRIQPKVV
jgi:hypothetical protein